jgi:hypothetical protein
MSEDSKHKVVQNGNITKVKAAGGYCPHVGLLCKIKDTGNGFIVKFPSYSSVEQDNYICLDYAEAEYLYEGLKPIVEKWRVT